MKIYTKKGDKGSTSILGGSKLPKHDARIEAYGTVDELNSFTAVLRDEDIDSVLKKDLIRIQELLFVIGSHLATDESKSKIKLPSIGEVDVRFLEKRIDAMELNLPPMKYFLVPGGDRAVSSAHVARSVCRRAERRVSALGPNIKSAAIIIKYLNRLSDYFFVLSRRISADKAVPERPWKTR